MGANYPPLTGGIRAISICSSIIKSDLGKWWSAASRKEGKLLSAGYVFFVMSSSVLASTSSCVSMEI